MVAWRFESLVLKKHFDQQRVKRLKQHSAIKRSIGNRSCKARISWMCMLPWLKAEQIKVINCK